jgi:hypothetical protein
MNAKARFSVLMMLVSVLLGCATATRMSMKPEEKTERFLIQHPLQKSQAFSKVELALAETYNHLPTVLTLKQPDSGTFLLRPVIEYRIADLGGGFHGVERAPYTLKIVVDVGSISADFELGQNESGTWAPVSEVPKIKARFREIAEAIARNVNGTLASN